MLTHPTLDQLRALKLDGMVQAFIELEAQEEARNLAHACRWIAEHRGLLITGPSGMGKSWLSCALAQKACRDGYTVHYARVPRLFADLDLAHGDGRFARLFRLLVRSICSCSMIGDPIASRPASGATSWRSLRIVMGVAPR